MIYRLDAVTGGYVWQHGNTFDDETSAASEVAFWRANSPPSGEPGHVAAVGYWAWSPQAGSWQWRT